MKLITPFTILNQNFHEIDLIRDAMKNRKLTKKKDCMTIIRIGKCINIINLLR